MNVLIACEESQAVCKAFRAKGHNAFSCDLQECSGGRPEWHIVADVLPVIKGGTFVTQSGEVMTVEKWDMMIAHPPCTYLSYAGNGYVDIERYGQKAIERLQKRQDALVLFMAMYNAPIEKICIENPVGYMNTVFRKPDQTIHPYFFGDCDKKRTCLWLKGLPMLVHISKDDLFSVKSHTEEPQPTYIDKSGKARYFTDSISGSMSDTQSLRSKTFPGIAQAMADQWG